MRAATAKTATLTDAVDAAIGDWVQNVDTTHYIVGSAVGPHPYPMIVRDFQVRVVRVCVTTCCVFLCVRVRLRL